MVEINECIERLKYTKVEKLYFVRNIPISRNLHFVQK